MFLIDNTDGQVQIIHMLGHLSVMCHEENMRWWLDPNGKKIARNKGELLALVHSEISECLEGVRKGIPDSHLPHRSMEEVELADALIRIFDYAGAHNLNLGAALVEKMKYNRDRADHKAEVRAAQGGKKF